VQPERFGLKYTDEDGSEKTPVMIHFALMGSIERFIAVYIEHTKGKFPVWVSPEQIRIITVNQELKTVEFANSVIEKADALDLRVVIDNSNESVGKKIRQAEIYKTPYAIVVGDKEIESGDISPRIREDLKNHNSDVKLTIDDFLKIVAKESKDRVSKTSL
jgi:threonyl-tRNA synthetase